MTRKTQKNPQKNKPRPRLEKERLLDLDAKSQGEGVKGGAGKASNRC